MTEPVLSCATSLPAIGQAIQRSEAELVSTLKISGFVEITTANKRKATVQEIQGLLGAWGLQADAAALEGQIDFVEVKKNELLIGYIVDR